MRRLLHRTANLLCWLSLLLGLAVCALWLRSMRHDDWLEGTLNDRPWVAESVRGLIGVEFYRDLIEADGGLKFKSMSVEPKSLTTMEWHATDPAWSPRRWCGIGYARGYNWLQVFVPHAWCAAALLLPPLTRLLSALRRRYRLQRRLRLGLCPICGYDLRATPYRCPECGTATARAG